MVTSTLNLRMVLPVDLRSVNRQILFNDMSTTSLHRPLDVKDEDSYHLCVLVHGLWGNGSHLNYLTTSLREKFSEDELIILVCKRNASSFTYDGIEVGGERVTKEIEETITELKQDGIKIDRFSIIGYSLGGLIARYCVGLLDSKGYFDHIRPVNFTTFASPHLGVRTPLRGYSNQLWNVLGARTLSASGRQLFTVDDFRQTGRPLLSVLADPDSIFIHALAKFKNRSLYANIINDRTAVYYTTGISRKDPYMDLEKVVLNYLPGFENVILDPEQPYQLAKPKQLPTFTERVTGTSQTILRRAPIIAGLSLVLPIAIVVFLINSGIQTLRSQKRIVLHESDTDDSGFAQYRISWMVQSVRAGIEDVFEATNSAQQQEYLPDGSEELVDGDTPSSMIRTASSDVELEKAEEVHSPTLRRKSTSSPSEFPTLALTPAQFGMINALDEVGFKKFGVHIQKSTHSHAALIVRSNKKAFDDGKVVVRHWLDTNFIL